MPRPEHRYKMVLYSWPVEAVNWAASLLRPDATGLLENFCPQIPITTRSSWEGLSVLHFEGMSVLFTVIYSSMSMNAYGTYHINT